MVADVVIENIGAIVSGDLNAPLIEGKTIVVRDGRVAEIGSADQVSANGIEHRIDADGSTVVPGLIDSHIHPVLGDFTPRQNTVGFLESYVHGGVTTAISVGEVHAPGRPKDAVGTKALAILAAKAFRSFRPNGMKILGGAVLLERGLTREDFKEMAAAGVRLVGEIGISGIATADEALPMVQWAHEQGMKVVVHTGGASVPGSSVIGADLVVRLQPDIAAHVNGGPTAPPLGDVERIIQESQAAIEVVQAGNVAALRDVIALAQHHRTLDRVLIGTDTPSGTGVIPLGVLRTIAWVSALAGVAPEIAVAMATGNTRRVFALEQGELRAGAPADLVIVDAPRGSQADDALQALAIGDTPAVLAVLIDGDVRVLGSRNSPPGKRTISVPWMQAEGH